MNPLKLLLRRMLHGWPARQSQAGNVEGAGDGYRGVRLSEDDIANREYLKYLGGGAEKWQQRGAFQLHFLRAMGLVPGSRLLDIGCGPIRAGIHLIRFLDEGGYLGFDYNEDFIKASRTIVEEQALSQKRPEFEVVSDFDVRHLDRNFDFAIAFSVLNHCSPSLRRLFFERIDHPIKANGKLFITHADWFREDYLKASNLRLARQYGRSDFDTSEWGWSNDESIFPIIELAVLHAD